MALDVEDELLAVQGRPRHLVVKRGICRQLEEATGFPGVLDALQDNSITITGNAVEIDGNIVTSRGPGTAMDFALTLIELLKGKGKRDEVNQQLQR